MPTTKVTYNEMKPAANATVSDQAIAHLTNTVSRTGPFDDRMVDCPDRCPLLSTVLGVVGVKGSAGTQIAATAAPVVLAIGYAFVRAHTKGVLAKALFAPLPQAASNPPSGPSSDQTSTPSDASPALASTNGKSREDRDLGFDWPNWPVEHPERGGTGGESRTCRPCTSTRVGHSLRAKGSRPATGHWPTTARRRR